MPALKEFFALSISLIKRDSRSVVKVSETVAPFGYESIIRLTKDGDPSASRLLTILGRLRERLGESGNPRSFEEAVKIADERTADAKADELQELLNAVRRQDPNVGLVVRDDYSTGLRILSIVTKLPASAHADKARKAQAIYDAALSMVDEETELKLD